MYRIVTKTALKPTVILYEIEAPMVAKKAQPGQFIILRVDENGERIPITIHDYDREKGTVTIIVQTVGATTEKLSHKQQGEFIQDFVGPLGRPTETEGKKKVCVVGGGVGCAIAYPVLKKFHDCGAEVHAVVGFKNKDVVILEDKFRAVSSVLKVCTDDGSYGEKGFGTVKLQQLLDDGAQALVFDVRFNPGGFVDVLVNMLDELLPKGTVISITDKAGESTTYSSDEECVKLPMAVLCNEYSISAAEFFAASLQEYGVATVVGEHTLGKGYAQTMIPLTGGGALNLSTSRYYTAKGVSLAGVGITPDVESSLSEDKLNRFYTLQPEEDDQLQKALEVLRQQMSEN